jgi:CBS domain-containing protein
LKRCFIPSFGFEDPVGAPAGSSVFDPRFDVIGSIDQKQVSGNRLLRVLGLGNQRVIGPFLFVSYDFYEEANVKVKNVMHTGVTWVEPSTPLTELAKRMRDEDIGAIPVGDNDRLVGMVTDRDITCRGLADGRDIKSLTARDVMTRPILYCRTEVEVECAVRLMERNAIRRLPVINEKFRMVGMLSLGDIAATAGRDLSAEAVHAVAHHHA